MRIPPRPAVLFMGAALAPVLAAQTWVSRTLDLGPSYLRSTFAAFDEGRGRYVARGGGTGTWEWDGSSWGLRATGADFTAIFGIAIAYDGRDVLAFGGSGAVSPLGETWRWDGQTWTQVQPSRAPSARYWSAMAFDRGRSRVVLFGGWAGRDLDDTWEWDGSTWTERVVAGPQARSRHAMTYDAARGRILLCGGYAGNPMHDTWEWDGASWQLRATDGALTEGSMAFDVDRGRAVSAAFFGNVATFEWDGSAWSQRTPAHRPPGFAINLVFDSVRRRVVATTIDGLMAWDGDDWHAVQDLGSPQRQTGPALVATATELLLLGQRQYPSPAVVQDVGLSAWNGQRWRIVPNASLPVSELLVATAAFDAARQRVVAFGGLARTGNLGGTWEWSSSAGWQQLAPVPAPTARWDHGMTFDAGRGRIVLFGGQDDGGLRDDTWTWDGTTWTAHASAARPAARKNHRMEYDARRQRVVLFGGQFGDQATWEWDGSEWTAVAPTSPSYAEGSWYDAERQRVVVVTRTNGLLDSVHEWDGQAWTRRGSVPAEARGLRPIATAFDAVRGRSVVVGNGMAIAVAETWIVGDTLAASVTPRGNGCAAQVAPQLLGFCRPTIGRSDFHLELARAAPAAPAAFVLAVQPADLALGNGCTLLIDPASVAVSLCTVLDGGGNGLAALPVPDRAHLAGTALHVQAFVLDASAPFQGLAMSSGLRCVVGD